MKFTKFIIVLLCFIFGFYTVNSAAIPNTDDNMSELLSIVLKNNYNKKLTLLEKERLCNTPKFLKDIIPIIYCSKFNLQTAMITLQDCIKTTETKINKTCRN